VATATLYETPSTHLLIPAHTTYVARLHLGSVTLWNKHPATTTTYSFHWDLLIAAFGLPASL
jgi:hypothetical protein